MKGNAFMMAHYLFRAWSDHLIIVSKRIGAKTDRLLMSIVLCMVAFHFAYCVLIRIDRSPFPTQLPFFKKTRSKARNSPQISQMNWFDRVSHAKRKPNVQMSNWGRSLKVVSVFPRLPYTKCRSCRATKAFRAMLLKNHSSTSHTAT